MCWNYSSNNIVISPTIPNTLDSREPRSDFMPARQIWLPLRLFSTTSTPKGITSVTCLGDLVGYGPQPNEVINLVRGRNIQTCQGCWDEDIIDGLNSCENASSYPSQLAERRGHRAHEWTAEILTDENKQFLAELPMTLRRGTMLFVHGSPNSQTVPKPPDMNAFAALERVETAGAETMFCGHTHHPYVRELSGGSFESECNR